MAKRQVYVVPMIATSRREVYVVATSAKEARRLVEWGEAGEAVDVTYSDVHPGRVVRAPREDPADWDHTKRARR